MSLPFGSRADLMNEAGARMPKCSFIQLALSEAHLCACSVLSKATIWFLLLRATLLDQDIKGCPELVAALQRTRWNVNRHSYSAEQVRLILKYLCEP